MTKKLNIAFAGGGTGGHVTPISSLIEYASTSKQVKEQINDLFWFGTKGQLEESYAQKFDEVTFVPIMSGKLRRFKNMENRLTGTLENMTDFLKVNAGYLQSLRLLQKYKIDALFCKGGYVALPVSFAAASLRIPVIVHESDMHAGLVNKFVAKVAKKSFGGFPGSLPSSHHIGQILSPDLLKPNVDMDLFPLQSDKKNVLVICGSQGSEVVFREIKSLIDKGGQVVKNVNFIIILGLLNASWKKKFKDDLQVVTYDFLDAKSLARLFKESDLSITRGSATTLAELEYFNLQKIIIPLPSHDQPLNAGWYVENKGDIAIKQDNIKELINALQYSIEHPRKEKASGNNNFFAPHKAVWESLLDSDLV